MTVAPWLSGTKYGAPREVYHRRVNALTRIRAIGLLGLALLIAHSAGAQPVAVEADAPWVRAAPPGAAMMAGYATLHNRSQVTAQLIGAVSDDFGLIEIHRTEIVDGVGRMRPVSAVDIAPEASARLEPGGVHLMLMRPARPLAEGDYVSITLRFDDGATLAVDFPVLRQAPAR